MSAAVAKRRGPVLPSTCTIGEMFHLTSAPGGQDCICVSTDTWECHGATPTAFPGIKIGRTTAQSIPELPTTPNFVLFDDDVLPNFDDNGWGDVGGAFPDRVTFDITGRVAVSIAVRGIFTGGSADLLCIQGFLNGVESTERACFTVTPDPLGCVATFMDIVTVVPGDFIQVSVEHDQAGPIDITATATAVQVK